MNRRQLEMCERLVRNEREDLERTVEARAAEVGEGDEHLPVLARALDEARDLEGHLGRALREGGRV